MKEAGLNRRKGIAAVFYANAAKKNAPLDDMLAEGNQKYPQIFQYYVKPHKEQGSCLGDLLPGD